MFANGVYFPIRSSLLLIVTVALVSSQDYNEYGIPPPKSIAAFNATETKLKLSWERPDTTVPISGYTVTARALKTYSEYPLEPLSWTFSNTTFRTELLNLHPGTLYNISVQAVQHQMEGEPTSIEAETHIGEPEPSPLSPTIVENRKNKIIIKIHPSVNHNGPVTAYRIIVSDESQMMGFDADQLKPYREAQSEDLGYYITAELKPQDLEHEFVVGDSRTYNGYYNAPLERDDTSGYRVTLGLVSSLNGVTRVRYSTTPHARIIFNIPNAEDNDSQSLVMGLTAAIAVFGVLLVLAVLLYVVLRRRLPPPHRRDAGGGGGDRRRGRGGDGDQQELALRGPIVEVENSGYVPDIDFDHHHHLAEADLVRADSPMFGRDRHRTRLGRQVWNIPRNFLRTEPDDGSASGAIGYGRFGRVTRGTLRDAGGGEAGLGAAPAGGPGGGGGGGDVIVAVQTIDDGELEAADKRSMLRDLDTLIKIGRQHQCVDHLIGICESADHLSVVLSHSDRTLKDALLASRDLTGRSRKFSTEYTESEVLGFAKDVASGMEYLAGKSIVHRQLCCRNIRVFPGGSVKVSGFGLADYQTRPPPARLDYRRWSALEALRPPATQQQRHLTEKSDVWSFGCLLWECCALGATPYSDVPTGDVPARVLRGTRPPQLRNIGDDMYQRCLDCWQIDPDERPSFAGIVRDLYDLLVMMKTTSPGGGVGDGTSPVLSFARYDGFEHARYSEDLEYETGR